MRLVEGLDYVIRVVPFPHCAADAFVMSHPDGIACVYVNSRVCPDRQKKALKHELLHVLRDDLYSTEDVLEIEGRMND